MTAPQRLSVQEAAEHFGVSPSTIRRWIGSTELRSEREDTAQGTRIWVYPELDEDEPAAEVETMEPAIGAVAASSALVTSLEERIRSLEMIVSNELRAGTELRALLSHEQAAHQATRAELDGLKEQQWVVTAQQAIPVDEPRREADEPATLNALATLRAQYERLQDRNAHLQLEVYSLIEKVAAAQQQPPERPGLLDRIFGAALPIEA